MAGNANFNARIGLAFEADTKQAKLQIENLQKSIDSLIKTTAIKSNLGIESRIKNAEVEVAKLRTQLEQAVNVKTGGLDLGLLNKSFKESGSSIEHYKDILTSLGPEGKQVFNELANSIIRAETPLKQTSTLMEKFKNTLKNTARWQISSSMLHGFIGSIQTAYHYAEDLNKSLNNIRIVTGKNIDEMADFAVEANKAAKALNTTTTEYTNASLIYYQQGLSTQEVKERTDVTIKMANVARESAEEVSQQLTAVWNNFAKGGENLEYYADVMTALGAATASSTDEIAEGLEKFAAVSETVGLSYEYATAALATVTATTRQSADIVGNAFKTLFGRLQGLKLGETLEDGTDLNKYSEALNSVGVNIKNTDGELKEMDTILDELSVKWKTLGDAEKVALANTVGGVRQYTQLIALMDNWDFFEQNLDTAKNAEGALQKQQDIYAEGWEAARDRVTAALEEIYNTLLNDDFFIDLTNTFADFVGWAKKLVDTLGGVPGLLSGIGSLITNIYSKEMAAGLDRFIYNLQGPEKMAQQLTEDTVKAMQNAGLDDVYAKYMTGPQQAYVSIAKQLNEYEKNILKVMLDEHEVKVKLLEDDKKSIGLLEAKLKEQENIVNRQKRTLGLQYFGKAKDSRLENITSEYLNQKNTIIDIGKLIKYDEEGREEEFANLVKNIDPTKLNNKFVTNAINFLQGKGSNIKQYNKDTAMGALYTAYGEGELKEQLKNNFRNNLININIKEEDANSYVDNVEKMSDTTEQLGEKIDAVVEREKNLKKVTTDLIQKFIDWRKENKALITPGQGILGASQALTGFAMALNNLKGIMSSFNGLLKGEISLWDFLTSGLLSIGMLIPSLIRAWEGLKIALATTAGTVGIIIAAIAVLAVTIYSVGNSLGVFDSALDKANKKAEKAKEVANKLSEAYDSVKKSYDDLKSSLSDYNESLDALKHMTKGTQEWKDAVFELNEQILELLNKYPSLAEMIEINEDGLMTITTEGQNQLLKEQQDRVKSAYNTKLSSELTSTQAEKELIYENGYRPLIEEYIKSNRAVLKDEEFFNQFSQNNSIFDTDSLEKLRDGVIEDAEKIRAKEQQENTLKQSLGSSLLDKAGYSDEQSSLIKNLTAEAQLSYEEDLKDYYENMGVYGDNFLSRITEWTYELGGEEDDSFYGVDSDEIKTLYDEIYGHGEYDKLNDDAAARTAVAIAKAQGQAIENTENYITALNHIRELNNNVSETSLEVALGTYNNLDQLTQEEIENLDKLRFNEKDLEDLKQDPEKVDEQIKKAKEEYSRQWKAIQEDLLASTRDILAEINLDDDKDMTLKAKEDIANFLNRAVILGAEDSIAGIKQGLSDGSIDSKNFADAISQINWDTVTVREYKNIMKDAGVEVEETDDQLVKLIQEMRTAKTSFKELAENYAEVHKIVDNLEIGDSISEEDYTKIQDYGSEYFTLMLDGTYKLTGDAQEFYDTVQNSLIEDATNRLKELEQGGAVTEEERSFLNKDSDEMIQSNRETYLDLIRRFTDADLEELTEYRKLISGEFEGAEEDRQALEDRFKNRVQGISEEDVQNRYIAEYVQQATAIASSFDNLADMREALESGKLGDDRALALQAYNNAALNLDRVKDIESLDADELKEYTSYLKEADEEIEGMNDDLDDFEAKTVAKSIMKMNQGIETLVSNWETWSEVLSESSKGSEEYNNAISDTTKAMADLLDINEEYISSDFIEGHLDSITKLVEGDFTQIEALKNDLSAAIGESLAKQLASSEEEAAQLASRFSDLRDLGLELQDLEVGVSLTGEDKFVQQLNHLIEDTGMTVDQVNALCDSLGFDTHFVEQDNDLVTRVPVTETVTFTRDAGEGDANALGLTDKELEAGNVTVMRTATVETGKYNEFHGNVPAWAMSTDGSTPKIQVDKLTKKAGSSFANTSTSGANKKSGGSKSKSKKDKKSSKDEIDRYWNVNNAIKKIDNSFEELSDRMERTQTISEHLFGKALIRNLKEQNKQLDERNKLIESQKDNYEELYKIQQGELGELKGTLGAYGGNFNGNVLTNYNELMTKALADYNAAVDKFNASAQEEADQAAFEAAERTYETLKTTIDRYQVLYYSEMAETNDKLRDLDQEALENRLKQLENNLKAWETKIQIKLDLREAKRQWREFLKETSTDFTKVFKDLKIDSNYSKSDFNSYRKDTASYIKQMNKVEEEIDKIRNGGKSSMFASVSEAQEYLKELEGKMQESAKNAFNAYKEGWDTYIEGIQQAADQFDVLNDKFENISDQLEYQRELIELIYGEEAYDLMSEYYEAQKVLNQGQIESTKEQAAFWKKTWEDAIAKAKADENDSTTWNTDIQEFYNNWQSAQSNVNSLILEGVKLLKDEFANNLNKSFEELDNAVWGQSFDKVKENWEMMQSYANEYLDDVEGGYRIQTLANKINKSINETTNLKVQQKLAKLREDEINALREKKNLTQDDIDLAEARYQIALKEIALEDAQNQKNSMKLTRDASGNWTYQYVADEGDIADKKQDLLDSYNNLYEIADKAYQHSMELAMNLYDELKDKIRAVAEDQSLTEEQKIAKIEELETQYFEWIDAAVGNSETYRREAKTATAATLKEIYDQDEEAYGTYTENEKTLVDGLKDHALDDYEQIRNALIGGDDGQGLYPKLSTTAEATFNGINVNSQTSAADIIAKWAGDGDDSVKSAFGQLNTAIGGHLKTLSTGISDLGADTDALGIDVGEVTTKVEDLSTQTGTYVKNASANLTALATVVSNLATKWSDVADETEKAHLKALEYYKLDDDTNSGGKRKNRDTTVNPTYSGNNGGSGSGSGSGSGDSTPEGNGDGVITTKGGTRGYSDKELYLAAAIATGHFGISAADVLKMNDKDLTTVLGYTSGTTPSRLKRLLSKDGNYIESYINSHIDSYRGNLDDFFGGTRYYITSNKKSKLEILKGIIESLSNRPEYIDNLAPNFSIGYDTGGYTGTWDSSGRLAFLHQKELVLNAEDTANMLQAVSTIRDLAKINSSIDSAIATSIGQMALNLVANSGGSFASSQNSSNTENQFYITAEFPNADDVNSIREAILSLPNLASQWAHSDRH